MPLSSRVLIVDDHVVARLGVMAVLERAGNFDICGEAGEVAMACELAEKLQPDLIVVDLMLGGRDGPELIAELRARCASARILVYTSQDERRFARRALRAGAQGYVMKSAGLADVQQAMAALARGEPWVSEAVRRALVEEAAGLRRSEAPGDALSERELQIFRLLGERLTSAEIARELNLSVKTIGTYRERIKSKLGAETARELERRAETFVSETGSDGVARRQS